ncbi:FAD-binding oxidoreductase [Telmatospirillum sp. J64-1]|uniref:FAD-binding oxidoreductase n=1 Tax=Telmatospirillum sp. J64-1 TaxID=2502183 RepID=UPI00115DBF99|nr:FAD-binding oxidoreductase [Telmatospirillum sp. J64-1]
MMLSGWGNFPRLDCRVAAMRGVEDIRAVLDEAPLIARGNGRSYGDAALQPHLTLLSRHLDRFLAFDPANGRLTCEAGVRLETILEVFVPRGWFPPVTPGTKFVTVGGMIASDVHGKNHHVAGSFGRHVESMRVMVADGRILECSRQEHADLFAATIGGMGLTGIILSASFRLLPIQSAWIRQETIRATTLEETLEAFEESADWTYTVSWIDCLQGGKCQGRSLLTRGEHAMPDELPAEVASQPLQPRRKRLKRVPMDFPSWALNSWSVRAFNALYYGAAPKTAAPRIVDYDSFFYPLDAILEWNRIYGRHGFTQYQCVLPKQAGREGLRRLLNTIQKTGSGSFLAVLKLFGKQDDLMSFPMEGYTLALDFPLRGPTLGLLLELDAIVADHGGRLYLAKDARSTPHMFRKGYPGVERFQEIRAHYGARGKMQSLQAERLDL